MLFLHKKHLTQRNLYTQTAHRSFMKFLQTDFLHAETLLRAVFLHSRNFFAQKPLRTKKNAQQVFADRQFLHTESSPHRSLTHRRFYAQFFFYIDIQTFLPFFTHRCLYTETNCTQKLVHTARVYTQPAFTQRGFASPSWSPTFRVPLLKLKQCSNLSAAGYCSKHQQTVVHLNQQFPTLGNPLHRDPVAWDVTRSSRTVWTKAEQEMQELRERESELESSERHFFQQEEDLMQQATYLCRFCSGYQCLVPRCSCVLQKRINYGLQLSHNQNPSHSVTIVIVST